MNFKLQHLGPTTWKQSNLGHRKVGLFILTRDIVSHPEWQFSWLSDSRQWHLCCRSCGSKNHPSFISSSDFVLLLWQGAIDHFLLYNCSVWPTALGVPALILYFEPDSWSILPGMPFTWESNTYLVDMFIYDCPSHCCVRAAWFAGIVCEYHSKLISLGRKIQQPHKKSPPGSKEQNCALHTLDTKARVSAQLPTAWKTRQRLHLSVSSMVTHSK